MENLVHLADKWEDDGKGFRLEGIPLVSRSQFPFGRDLLVEFITSIEMFLAFGLLCLIVFSEGNVVGRTPYSSLQFETTNLSAPVNDWEGVLNFLTTGNSNPASEMSTPEAIQFYGYPAESHRVVTKDGYVLGLHRIPHGKNGQTHPGPKGQRPVVFLQHGLFASSFEWFMNTPDKLIALQLADAGYDVWLGNVRGNAYSRAHVTLSPSNPEFWEFSMHEMGKFDITASIDYVLNTTSQEQLNYVGFSMGTSMFWIMMSQHPEYNAKVKLMTALAPVIYINNMKGFPRFLGPFARESKNVMDFLFQGEFLPPWLLRIFNSVGTKFCSNLFIAESICANINFLYAGWDLPQTQMNQLPLFYSHTPSPTSVRTLIHIAQFINNGIFQEYDFGISGNLKAYGLSQPPKYTLANTTVPVALLWGLNDAVVEPVDVVRLSSELPNVVYNKPVNFTLWNHFDYHMAKDVNHLVNEPLLELLHKYQTHVTSD